MMTTLAARAAAVLVAVVAGAASYEHIASVALAAGERTWVAYTLPLAIDGLIVVGVAALLEDKANGRAGRPVARVAIVAGVLATLAANYASAEPGAQAKAVAVAAPVAFLLAVEVLTRRGRPLTATEAANDADTGPVAAPAKATPQRPLDEAEPRPSAALTLVKAAAADSDDAGDGQHSYMARIADLLRQQPDLSGKQLAAEVGCSPRTARRYAKQLRGQLATT